MKVETYTEAALGTALAARVALDLRAAIGAKGRASMAVPGGSTPGPFLSALAKENLDWDKVTVTLTDERCVPADHARSNQMLVAQHLLQGRAQAAQFVALYADDQEIDKVEAALTQQVLPLNVCVLGMGSDMHTASLFPGTPGLARLLDLNSDRLVDFVDPPDANEPRVTLTARALAAANHTYLLIKGADKHAALERAMKTEDREAAPIRAILDATPAPVVFYAA